MTTETVCHHLFDTPFGIAAVAFERNGSKLKRIFLPRKTPKAIEALLNAHSVSAPSVPLSIGKLCENIKAYFCGKRIDFTRQALDFRPMSVLEQEVLHKVSQVAYGKTKTYGQIAHEIGRPKAYRFVGTTLAKNPFPVVIPCHRVIRGDGSLGGFGGGTDLKKRMLEMEQTPRRKQ
jgi:methylated-DNA-[protein]-cysteine S-methyltransferase